VRLAIKKHWLSFALLTGIAVIACAVAVYILSQQDFRFPLVEESPKRIQVELSNAQAVQPGQGQSVRVAGIEVGRIGDVELEDGVAVVDLEIDRRYEELIRQDATVLLRPKTALKDMFIEVDPGTGAVLDEGERIPAANSLPDIDPDEIYAALDEDTRPYLKLLVSGAGKGLRGRGDDLREVLRRLEPVHEDLARVTRATASRREALKRLIHDYGLLMTEVGRRPAELRRLVSASGSVFDALAAEQGSISESVARLPGALRATERTLQDVRRFAPLLRSSLQSLRRPIRRLDETNEAVTPFLRDTTPVLSERIRPFVRAARPFTDDLRLAARDTAKATPDLSTSIGQVNRLFNIGAFNPGGAEGLDGLSIPQQRQRQEGYLYWLAWTAQNGVSLFSSADGQGPWRRVTICGLPAAAVEGIVQQTLAAVRETNPALVEQLIGGAGPLIEPGSPVDDLLATQFGSCNFGALPQP
jgi:phospholipid/cholesterol/gamma-HCH transport system substrate-binding protein